MNHEPRWRIALCWSATVAFFAIPLLIFGLHLLAVELDWKFDNHFSDFSGIMPVYQTVSALLFGLAGLNSLDRFFNGKK